MNRRKKPQTVEVLWREQSGYIKDCSICQLCLYWIVRMIEFDTFGFTHGYLMPSVCSYSSCLCQYIFVCVYIYIDFPVVRIRPVHILFGVFFLKYVFAYLREIMREHDNMRDEISEKVNSFNLNLIHSCFERTSFY